MKTIIIIIHSIVTVGLIGLILLQNGKGGLGGGLGSGEFYRSKRGAERIVFISTIILGIIFFVTSLLNVFIR
jgi:preprotein translocase subunit SecG